MPTLSWINDTQARQESSKVPFHLLETGLTHNKNKNLNSKSIETF